MEYHNFNTSIPTNSDDSSEEGYFYEHIEDLMKPWTHESYFIPLVMVYGIVFLLGIAGNFAVIFAVLGGRNSRSVTFCFMVSLAVADILFLVVCVPHEILRMVLVYWSGGRTYCKISGFVEMLTAVSSIINLAAVSLERYFVIVMPMQSRTKCTMGNTRRILVVVWVVAVVLSAPALYVKDVDFSTYYNNETSVVISFCTDYGLTDDSQQLGFYIYQFLIMFAIPTVLIIYCYIVVIYSLWISSRTLVNLTSTKSLIGTSPVSSPHMNRTPSTRKRHFLLSTPSDHRDSILKGRKQIIKMLITVILVFLMCWGPKLIMQLLKKMQIEMFKPEIFNLQIAIYCLPYIQSCLNPVVYLCMSKNFRTSLASSCNKHVYMGTMLCDGKNSPVQDFELESRYSNGTVHTKFAHHESETC